MQFDLESYTSGSEFDGLGRYDIEPPPSRPDDFTSGTGVVMGDTWRNMRQIDRKASVDDAFTMIAEEAEKDKTRKVAWQRSNGEDMEAPLFNSSGAWTTMGKEWLQQQRMFLDAAANDEDGGFGKNAMSEQVEISPYLSPLLKRQTKQKGPLDDLQSFVQERTKFDTDTERASLGYEDWIDWKNSSIKDDAAKLDPDNKALKKEWINRLREIEYDPTNMKGIGEMVNDKISINPDKYYDVDAVEAFIQGHEQLNPSEKKLALIEYRTNVEAAIGKIVNNAAQSDAGIIGSYFSSPLSDEFRKGAEDKNFSGYEFLKANKERFQKSDSLTMEIAQTLKDALLSTGTGALFLSGKLAGAMGAEGAERVLTAPAEAHGWRHEQMMKGFDNEGVAFSVGSIDITRRDLTELTGQVGSFVAMGGIGRLGVAALTKAGLPAKAASNAMRGFAAGTAAKSVDDVAALASTNVERTAKALGVKGWDVVKAAGLDATAYAAGLQAGGMSFGREHALIMEQTGDADEAFRKASLQGVADSISAFLATTVMNRFGLGAEALFGGTGPRAGGGLIQNIRSRTINAETRKATQEALKDIAGGDKKMFRQLAKDHVAAVNARAKAMGLRGWGVVGGTISEGIEETMDEVISTAIMAMHQDSQSWSDEFWGDIHDNWQNYVKAGILGAIGGTMGSMQNLRPSTFTGVAKGNAQEALQQFHQQSAKGLRALHDNKDAVVFVAQSQKFNDYMASDASAKEKSQTIIDEAASQFRDMAASNAPAGTMEAREAAKAANAAASKSAASTGTPEGNKGLPAKKRLTEAKVGGVNVEWNDNVELEEGSVEAVSGDTRYSIVNIKGADNTGDVAAFVKKSVGGVETDLSLEDAQAELKAMPKGKKFGKHPNSVLLKTVTAQIELQKNKDQYAQWKKQSAPVDGDNQQKPPARETSPRDRLAPKADSRGAATDDGGTEQAPSDNTGPPVAAAVASSDPLVQAKTETPAPVSKTKEEVISSVLGQQVAGSINEVDGEHITNQINGFTDEDGYKMEGVREPDGKWVEVDVPIESVEGDTAVLGDGHYADLKTAPPPSLAAYKQDRGIVLMDGRNRVAAQRKNGEKSVKVFMSKADHDAFIESQKKPAAPAAAVPQVSPYAKYEQKAIELVTKQRGYENHAVGMESAIRENIGDEAADAFKAAGLAHADKLINAHMAKKGESAPATTTPAVEPLDSLIAELEKEIKEESKQEESKVPDSDKKEEAPPVNLPPTEKAAVEVAEEVLTDEDKARFSESIGEKSWTKKTAVRFVGMMNDWVASGQKAFGKMASLFKKVWAKIKKNAGKASVIISVSSIMGISPTANIDTLRDNRSDITTSAPANHPGFTGLATDYVSAPMDAETKAILENGAAYVYDVEQAVNITIAETPAGKIDPSINPDPVKKADLKGATLSSHAQRMANWVVANGDNAGKMFVIADKKAGTASFFDKNGVLIRHVPALYGSTISDFTTDKILAKSTHVISNAEKITPSGRFETWNKVSTTGNGIVAVYREGDRSNLAFHKVYLKKPEQQREQRLATPTGEDNRVTHGCINLTLKDAKELIPLMDGGSVTYILPETKEGVKSFKGFEEIIANEAGSNPLSALLLSLAMLAKARRNNGSTKKDVAAEVEKLIAESNLSNEQKNAARSRIGLAIEQTTWEESKLQPKPTDEKQPETETKAVAKAKVRTVGDTTPQELSTEDQKAVKEALVTLGVPAAFRKYEVVDSLPEPTDLFDSKTGEKRSSLSGDPESGVVYDSNGKLWITREALTERDLLEDSIESAWKARSATVKAAPVTSTTQKDDTPETLVDESTYVVKPDILPGGKNAGATDNAGGTWDSVKVGGGIETGSSEQGITYYTYTPAPGMELTMAPGDVVLIGGDKTKVLILEDSFNNLSKRKENRPTDRQGGVYPKGVKTQGAYRFRLVDLSLGTSGLKANTEGMHDDLRKRLDGINRRFWRSTLDTVSDSFSSKIPSLMDETISDKDAESLFDQVVKIVMPGLSKDRIVKGKMDGDETNYLHYSKADGNIHVDIKRFKDQIISRYGGALRLDSADKNAKLAQKLLAMDVAQMVGHLATEEGIHLVTAEIFDDAYLADFYDQLSSQELEGEFFRNLMKQILFRRNRSLFPEAKKWEDVDPKIITDLHADAATEKGTYEGLSRQEKLDQKTSIAANRKKLAKIHAVKVDMAMELVRAAYQLAYTGTTTEQHASEVKQLVAAMRADMADTGPVSGFIRTLAEMVKRYARRIRMVLGMRYHQGHLPDGYKNILARIDTAYKKAGMAGDTEMIKRGAAESSAERADFTYKRMMDEIGYIATAEHEALTQLRDIPTSVYFNPSMKLEDVLHVDFETMKLTLRDDVRSLIQENEEGRGLKEIDEVLASLNDVELNGNTSFGKAMLHASILRAEADMRLAMLDFDPTSIFTFDSRNIDNPDDARLRIMAEIEAGAQVDSYSAITAHYERELENTNEQITFASKQLSSYAISDIKNLDIATVSGARALLKYARNAGPSWMGGYRQLVGSEKDSIRQSFDEGNLSENLQDIKNRLIKQLRTERAAMEYQPLVVPVMALGENDILSEKDYFWQRLAKPGSEVKSMRDLWQKRNNLEKLISNSYNRIPQDELELVNHAKMLEANAKAIEEVDPSGAEIERLQARLTRKRIGVDNALASRRYNDFKNYINANNEYNKAIEHVVQTAIGQSYKDPTGFGLFFVDTNLGSTDVDSHKLPDVTDETPVEKLFGHDPKADPASKSPAGEMTEDGYNEPSADLIKIQDDFRSVIESNAAFLGREHYRTAMRDFMSGFVNKGDDFLKYFNTAGLNLSSITEEESQRERYEPWEKVFRKMPGFSKIYALNKEMGRVAKGWDLSGGRTAQNVASELSEWINNANSWLADIERVTSGIEDSIGSEATLGNRISLYFNGKVHEDDPQGGSILSEAKKELESFGNTVKRMLSEGGVTVMPAKRLSFINKSELKKRATQSGTLLSSNETQRSIKALLAKNLTKEQKDILRSILSFHEENVIEHDPMSSDEASRYRVNGEPYISTTSLIGADPRFLYDGETSDAQQAFNDEKSEEGSKFHTILENWINKRNQGSPAEQEQGFLNSEAEQKFLDGLDANLSEMRDAGWAFLSEVVVADKQSMVAGKMDVLAVSPLGEVLNLDLKTLSLTAPNLKGNIQGDPFASAYDTTIDEPSYYNTLWKFGIGREMKHGAQGAMLVRHMQQMGVNPVSFKSQNFFMDRETGEVVINPLTGKPFKDSIPESALMAEEIIENRLSGSIQGTGLVNSLSRIADLMTQKQYQHSGSFIQSMNAVGSAAHVTRKALHEFHDGIAGSNRGWRENVRKEIQRTIDDPNYEPSHEDFKSIRDSPIDLATFNKLSFVLKYFEKSSAYYLGPLWAHELLLKIQGVNIGDGGEPFVDKSGNVQTRNNLGPDNQPSAVFNEGQTSNTLKGWTEQLVAPGFGETESFATPQGRDARTRANLENSRKKAVTEALMFLGYHSEGDRATVQGDRSAENAQRFTQQVMAHAFPSIPVDQLVNPLELVRRGIRGAFPALAVGREINEAVAEFLEDNQIYNELERLRSTPGIQVIGLGGFKKTGRRSRALIDEYAQTEKLSPLNEGRIDPETFASDILTFKTKFERDALENARIKEGADIAQAHNALLVLATQGKWNQGIERGSLIMDIDLPDISLDETKGMKVVDLARRMRKSARALRVYASRNENDESSDVIKNFLGRATNLENLASELENKKEARLVQSLQEKEVRRYEKFYDFSNFAYHGANDLMEESRGFIAKLQKQKNTVEKPLTERDINRKVAEIRKAYDALSKKYSPLAPDPNAQAWVRTLSQKDQDAYQSELLVLTKRMSSIQEAKLKAERSKDAAVREEVALSVDDFVKEWTESKEKVNPGISEIQAFELVKFIQQAYLYGDGRLPIYDVRSAPFASWGYLSDNPLLSHLLESPPSTREVDGKTVEVKTIVIAPDDYYLNRPYGKSLRDSGLGITFLAGTGTLPNVIYAPQGARQPASQDTGALIARMIAYNAKHNPAARVEALAMGAKIHEVLTKALDVTSTLNNIRGVESGIVSKLTAEAASSPEIQELISKANKLSEKKAKEAISRHLRQLSRLAEALKITKNTAHIHSLYPDSDPEVAESAALIGELLSNRDFKTFFDYALVEEVELESWGLAPHVADGLMVSIQRIGLGSPEQGEVDSLDAAPQDISERTLSQQADAADDQYLVENDEDIIERTDMAEKIEAIISMMGDDESMGVMDDGIVVAENTMPSTIGLIRLIRAIVDERDGAMTAEQAEALSVSDASRFLFNGVATILRTTNFGNWEVNPDLLEKRIGKTRILSKEHLMDESASDRRASPIFGHETSLKNRKGKIPVGDAVNVSYPRSGGHTPAKAAMDRTRMANTAATILASLPDVRNQINSDSTEAIEEFRRKEGKVKEPAAYAPPVSVVAELDIDMINQLDEMLPLVPVEVDGEIIMMGAVSSRINEKRIAQQALLNELTETNEAMDEIDQKLDEMPFSFRWSELTPEQVSMLDRESVMEEMTDWFIDKANEFLQKAKRPVAFADAIANQVEKLALHNRSLVDFKALGEIIVDSMSSKGAFYGTEKFLEREFLGDVQAEAHLINKQIAQAERAIKDAIAKRLNDTKAKEKIEAKFNLPRLQIEEWTDVLGFVQFKQKLMKKTSRHGIRSMLVDILSGEVVSEFGSLIVDSGVDVMGARPGKKFSKADAAKNKSIQEHRNKVRRELLSWVVEISRGGVVNRRTVISALRDGFGMRQAMQEEGAIVPFDFLDALVDASSMSSSEVRKQMHEAIDPKYMAEVRRLESLRIGLEKHFDKLNYEVSLMQDTKANGPDIRVGAHYHTDNSSGLKTKVRADISLRNPQTIGKMEPSGRAILPDRAWKELSLAERMDWLAVANGTVEALKEYADQRVDDVYKRLRGHPDNLRDFDPVKLLEKSVRIVDSENAIMKERIQEAKTVAEIAHQRGMTIDATSIISDPSDVEVYQKGSSGRLKRHTMPKSYRNRRQHIGRLFNVAGPDGQMVPIVLVSRTAREDLIKAFPDITKRNVESKLAGIIEHAASYDERGDRIPTPGEPTWETFDLVHAAPLVDESEMSVERPEPPSFFMAFAKAARENVFNTGQALDDKLSAEARAAITGKKNWEVANYFVGKMGKLSVAWLKAEMNRNNKVARDFDISGQTSQALLNQWGEQLRLLAYVWNEPTLTSKTREEISKLFVKIDDGSFAPLGDGSRNDTTRLTKPQEWRIEDVLARAFTDVEGSAILKELTAGITVIKGPTARLFHNFFHHHDGRLRKRFLRKRAARETARRLMTILDRGVDGLSGRSAYESAKKNTETRIAKAAKELGFSSKEHTIGYIIAQLKGLDSRFGMSYGMAFTKWHMTIQSSGVQLGQLDVAQQAKYGNGLNRYLQANHLDIMRDASLAKEILALINTPDAENVINRNQGNQAKIDNEQDFRRVVEGIIKKLEGQSEKGADAVNKYADTIKDVFDDIANAMHIAKFFVSQSASASKVDKYWKQGEAVATKESYSSVPVRLGFAADPNSDEAKKSKREGSFVEDPADILSFREASFFSGLGKISGTERTKTVYRPLVINGLSAPIGMVDDALFRIYITPSFEVARRMVGRAVEDRHGLQTVVDQDSYMMAAFDGMDEQWKKDHLSDIDAALSTIASEMETIIKNDTQLGVVNTGFAEVARFLSGAYIARALASVEQYWNQSSGPIFGTMAKYAVTGNWEGIQDFFAVYGKQFPSAVQAFAAHREAKDGEYHPEIFIDAVTLFIRNVDPFVFYRAHEVSDEKSYVMRRQIRTGSGVVKGGLGLAAKNYEAFGDKMLSYTIGAPERLLGRALFVAEVRTELRRRNSPLAAMSIEEMIKHPDLIDPSVGAYARTKVNDMLGQSDQAKKAWLFQSRDSSAIMSTLWKSITRFSNHTASTGSNLNTFVPVIWNKQVTSRWTGKDSKYDQETYLEALENVTGTLVQNILFSILKPKMLIPMLGYVFYMLSGDDDDDAQRKAQEMANNLLAVDEDEGVNFSNVTKALLFGRQKELFMQTKDPDAAQASAFAEILQRGLNEVAPAIPVGGIAFSYLWGQKISSNYVTEPLAEQMASLMTGVEMAKSGVFQDDTINIRKYQPGALESVAEFAAPAGTLYDAGDAIVRSVKARETGEFNAVEIAAYLAAEAFPPFRELRSYYQKKFQDEIRLQGLSD